MRAPAPNRGAGGIPGLPPQGQLCPVGTGLCPSPTGREKTTFPYKALAVLPRLDSPAHCSFPFSSLSSSAGLECSPCYHAPPLQSPHPTHCHSLPEPAPLSWINSPKASPTQGLPGSGLLEAAQGSRKSNKGKTGLTCACDFSPTPDFWDPGLLEKEGCNSHRVHVLSFCTKSFPIRLPSLLPTLLTSLSY